MPTPVRQEVSADPMLFVTLIINVVTVLVPMDLKVTPHLSKAVFAYPPLV